MRPVLTVVLGFGFDRWFHADLAVEAAVVPPVDVLEERELELLEGSPWAVAGDQFGFELPDGRFGERVDAPIAVKLRLRACWVWCGGDA